MSIMDDDKIDNELIDDASLNDEEDDASIASADVGDDNDSMSNASSFAQEDIQDGELENDDNDDNVSIGSYENEVYDDLSQNVISEDNGDENILQSNIKEDINMESSDEDFDDDDDSLTEATYKKLDNIEIEDYTKLYHNDIYEHNSSEVQTLAIVTRDEYNNIIDDLHKTIPIMTKYERARILGQRAKQINAGAPPFVTPPKDTMDGYLIAIQELEAKRIPFIIRRPLPFGGCEYWKVSDLEII